LKKASSPTGPGRPISPAGVRGPDLNVWIDIAETFEAKLRALACHKSQIPDISEIEPSLRKWSREMGKAKGIECAECYRKLEVPE
jgi:LmbE family N-acetylglucosaminyl deacetylase